MKMLAIRMGFCLPLLVISGSAIANSEGTSAASATSQEATRPEDNSQSQLNEILVTAERRVETLNQAPVSVSVISPQIANDLGVRSLEQLAMVTPGITVTSANYAFTDVYIRGVGTLYTENGLENPVAIYEDGVYLERSYGNLLRVVDIANIQVVNGPQGTLYGRNATGGVILVNTADPTGKQGGEISAEFGNLSHEKITAVLNQPISDTLSFRFAGSWMKEDSYLRNDFYGAQPPPDSSDYLLRAKIKWTPSEATSALLTLEYAQNYTSTGDHLAEGAPSCLVCNLPGTQLPPVGFYHVNLDFVGYARNRYFEGSVKVDQDLGAFHLTNTASYRDQVFRGGADEDFTSATFFNFVDPCACGTTVTDDLVLASKFSGPLNALFGLSYLHDDGYISAVFSGAAYSSPWVNNSAVTTNSTGLFAEGYYDITDKFKLTVGGRYTSDSRSLSVGNNAAVEDAVGIGSFTRSADFHGFTPRAVLAYDSKVGNVYYSYSEGFKSGGFNTPAFTPAEPVKPEKIRAHEIGLKSLIFQQRLNTNIDVFYHDLTNLQTNILDPTAGGTLLENAAKVSAYGVEFRAQLKVSEGLTVGTSASYLHSRYVSYPDASITCAEPLPLHACSANLAGQVTPFSPEFQGSVSANYKFLVHGWEAGLASVIAYTSALDFSADAGGTAGFDRQGGYALVNFSGKISSPDNRYEVGLYANNALGKEYYLFRQTSQPLAFYDEPAAPRTFGIRLTYRFGE